MLARILRLMLAGEILFLALLVAYVGRKYGWSDTQSGLVLLGLALSGRAGLIAITFAYGWIYRSKRSTEQRIGLVTALGMMVKEYLAFVALFSLIQPFERWFMGGERLRRVAGNDLPVLLVHGYTCNRGAWWWMRRRLEKAGLCVATVNLEPMYASIDDYVDGLRQRIEEVCRDTGAQRLTLVAHSMGGLACRAYLARHGAGRVAQVMTLGTPHRGSEIARIALGRNGRQMEPDSPWLKALAARDLPKGLETTAIYSLHDNFVMPQERGAIEGWRLYPVVGIGHLAMGFSPRIAREIVGAIRDLSKP
jgi:triacylglycerol lipase